MFDSCPGNNINSIMAINSYCYLRNLDNIFHASLVEKGAAVLTEKKTLLIFDFNPPFMWHHKVLHHNGSLEMETVLSCVESGGETPGAKRNPRISSRPSGITCRFEVLKSYVGLLSVTGRMDPVTESSKYKMLKVFQTFGMSTNTDQVDGVHS